MAQEKGSGLNFVPVVVTKTTGEADRDPPGGTIYPTGRLSLNQEGTRAFDQVCREAGVDPREAAVWYGVIQAEKLVGAYPVHRTGSEAKVAIRRSDTRKTVTLYLKAVFQENPTLKVETRRDISVGPDVDNQGRPCLVIALQSTLPKRRTRRRNGQSETRTGNEAAKQSGKPAAVDAKPEPQTSA